MAETRSSSFSLSSSNTDWWNSSRGVPCRSRKGSADCREGSRTPFSVCQHKHGTGGGQGATARAAEAMLALKDTKKGKRKKKKQRKQHTKQSTDTPSSGLVAPSPHPAPLPGGLPPRPGAGRASPWRPRLTWNCSMALSGSVQLVSVSFRSSPLATPSSCSPAYIAAPPPPPARSRHGPAAVRPAARSPSAARSRRPSRPAERAAPHRRFRAACGPKQLFCPAESGEIGKRHQKRHSAGKRPFPVCRLAAASAKFRDSCYSSAAVHQGCALPFLAGSQSLCELVHTHLIPQYHYPAMGHRSRLHYFLSWLRRDIYISRVCKSSSPSPRRKPFGNCPAVSRTIKAKPT